MRSTMRTITDVNVDGRAVDTSKEGLSFTVNCDSLSRVVFNWRDMDTGSTRITALGNGVDALAERGQRLNSSLSSGFTAGHDYMCVPVIYQSDPFAAEDEASPALFDVYMGAGRVQADSSTATEIYIDKDISFFRAPVRVSDKLCGGLVIQLSDRTLLAESYDPTTGKATVSSARINGHTYSTRTTSQGESYKIITNYLICDAFVFYARKLPVVTLSYELTANGAEVTGAYSQAQNVPMQSWKMWAEYGYTYTSPYKQTIEHEKQYGFTIADTFPLIASAAGETASGCDIYCEVVTQDGQTAQAKLELRLQGERDMTLDVTGTAFRAVGFEGAVWLWRTEMSPRYGGQIQAIRYEGKSVTMLGGDPTISAPDTRVGVPATYYAAGRDSEGNLHTGVLFNKTLEKTRYWSLTKLTKTGLHSYTADISRRYEFTVDLAPSAIETVTGAAAYSTEARFPKVIRGNDRYDTGSFTAVLGSVRNMEAGYIDIAGWAEFIAEGGTYLLKTDSGDVKIVAITGNPARQYGSSLAELGLTRVTYTWVEVDDYDKAVL